MAPTSARFLPGLILNVGAALASLCMVPVLFIPMMKVAFVGLVSNVLVAGLLFLIAGLIINGGPVLGAVFAYRGVHRGVSILTAFASLGGLIALVAALQSFGLHVLDEEGHVSGPAPAACVQVTQDGSAVARPCNPNAGEGPAGDCPPTYFCLERVVDHPETTECSIYCQHDCQCPDRYRCVFSKCVR